MNVNIKTDDHIYGEFKKKFYQTEWIPKTKSSIILLIMDEETARTEVPFYLRLSSHPNVVRTFGLVKHDSRSTALVQECAPYGNLQTLLHSSRFQPSESILIRIFIQIIDAMIYIVSQNIIHGDLRCSNVLIFQMNSIEPKENLVKLTNFNSACSNDPSFIIEKQRAIPVRYCVPEILQSKDQSNYSELSDIYSMGVLMWEAYSKGNIPFQSYTNDNDVRHCRLNNEKLLAPNQCSNALWNAIHSCWLQEPEIRYNFKELRELISNVPVA